MTKDLLQEGMEKFACGDLVGATRLWLELVEKEPNNEHARSYLARIREVAPELTKEIPLDLGKEAPITTVSGESFVSPRIAEDEENRLEVLSTKLNHLMELDDFSHAFEVASEIVRFRPEHRSAVDAMAICQEKLELIFTTKIGSQDAVPRVLIPEDEILWLDLDHKAGFVLSQIDGRSSFRDILLVTGMDKIDSLRILARLVKDKIIGF